MDKKKRKRNHREVLVIEFLKSKKHLLKFSGISKEAGVPIWVLKEAMRTSKIPEKHLNRIIPLLKDFGLCIIDK